MRVLVGASAHNTHVQNMARALDEGGALFSYVTNGVDSFKHPLARMARSFVAQRLPSVDRQLRRRAVPDVPADRIHSRWLWEVPRLITNRIDAVEWEDRLWEHGEKQLDSYCARLVERGDVDAFLGVEYGALASIRRARSLGKAGVVAFLSPHHRTRSKWVDAEYETMPGLRSRQRARIERLAPERDARRDQEAREASWIVTGSSFTTRSLIEAGFDAAKMLTIPLGGPDPMPRDRLPAVRPASTVFVAVGPVSVRKGAHLLLRAWRHVAGRGAQLHFYGKVLLASSILQEAQAAPGGKDIVFHGSVPPSDLPSVYQSASALVLPTLCDGFGAVVSEALANGLPVITTTNAGAADCISEGRSGFLIPPGDVDALASRLQACVDRPDEIFEMREAALDAAATWTWADFRSTFRARLTSALTKLPEGQRGLAHA